MQAIFVPDVCGIVPPISSNSSNGKKELIFQRFSSITACGWQILICSSVKNVRSARLQKDWLEDLVVREIMKLIQDDAVIDKIVQLVMDVQNQENTTIPLLEKHSDLGRIRGDVRGAGIRLLTERNQLIHLNQPQRMWILKPGDNAIHFLAALESFGREVTAGEFNGLVRLKLEYL